MNLKCIQFHIYRCVSSLPQLSINTRALEYKLYQSFEQSMKLETEISLCSSYWAPGLSGLQLGGGV